VEARRGTTKSFPEDRTLTTDKKSTIAEAVAAASAQLIAALQEGKTEVLKSYLEAMGRFRKYSFTNTMLIFCQNPYATRVAGFHTWKTFGRSVSKGQHGIMIMAPMVRTPRAKADGKIVSIAEEPRQYVSFRPVYVFDEAQTEGDPMPDLRSNHVEGDATAHLARLVKHVAASGITLEYGDAAMSADGRSYGGKIVVKSGMPEAETFSVLVHELRARDVFTKATAARTPPRPFARPRLRLWRTLCALRLASPPTERPRLMLSSQLCDVQPLSPYEHWGSALPNVT
jgi:hypothetical protein